VQSVLDSLDALKRADLDELRRIIRQTFGLSVLIPMNGSASPGLQTVETEDGPAVFARQLSADDGVAEHDGPDAEGVDDDRRYWLVPRLRAAFLDGDAVIRQPLPASGATSDSILS
jgi:hypothetical protein